MKTLTFLTAISFLTITMLSCTTENTDTKSSKEDNNLTGTWLSSSTVETLNITSNQKSTGIDYSTIYINESATDIQISVCEKYGNASLIPITMARDNGLLKFVNIDDTPFLVVSADELTREFVINSSTEITNYTQRLIKLSSTIDLSRGSFQLNGPISVINSTHVCLDQYFGSTPDQGLRQKTIIPFDNDILEFNIGASKPLLIGTYQYDSSILGNSAVLFSFGIGSNSDIFWNTFSTNGLFTDFATLTITSSQPNLIEGAFSFTGQDGGDYTGSFSVNPYQ